jgi:hypothetical protein
LAERLDHPSRRLKAQFMVMLVHSGGISFSQDEYVILDPVNGALCYKHYKTNTANTACFS